MVSIRKCQRLTICFFFLIWQSSTIVRRAGLSSQYTWIEPLCLIWSDVEINSSTSASFLQDSLAWETSACQCQETCARSPTMMTDARFVKLSRQIRQTLQILVFKHRKICEYCPGQVTLSVSWLKFLNLSEIVDCVTKSINDPKCPQSAILAALGQPTQSLVVHLELSRSS